MKYKNPSEVVDAIQWFKDGDHPEVIKVLITPEVIGGKTLNSSA